MKGPKRIIKPQPVDLLIELLGLASLLMLLILPFLYMNRLPDEVPVHYDISGQADKYGTKGSIWILPLVGLLFFAGFSVLNRFPHVFNYPVRVSEENAERLYRIGTRTIRILKTLLVTMFLYINANTIYTAMGNSQGTNRIIIPGFIFLILVLTGAMIYKMIRNK